MDIGTGNSWVAPQFRRFFCLVFGLMLVQVTVFWDMGFAQPARKFYEAPPGYREEIDKLKLAFKEKYGYELLDLDQDWKKDEIEKLDRAFALLPETFLRMRGLNALYRASTIKVPNQELPVDEIPAATFPAFTPISRKLENAYNVYVGDEDPRIEFYSALFYEEPEDFINIVHHEMGHLFDMVNGFLSFSRPWLELTHFQVVHMPALDARPDSDFVFAFISDPQTEEYSPVADRHIPTYSRQNPQEDFANAVAAYINYPYFRYSHPERYQFLKERVFGGRDYFPDRGQGSFEEKLLADLEAALVAKDWQKGIVIAREAARSPRRGLHSRLVGILVKFNRDGLTREEAMSLGVASCYCLHPLALELRMNLIRSGLITAEDLLKQVRCRAMGRDHFEKVLAVQPLQDPYFFREGGERFLQFLDPAMFSAFARGFETSYTWRLYAVDSKRDIANGSIKVKEGNGSVKIELKGEGPEAIIADGQKVALEVQAKRVSPATFKEFVSKPTGIQFVWRPWFEYRPAKLPEVHVVYPRRPAFQEKRYTYYLDSDRTRRTAMLRLAYWEGHTLPPSSYWTISAADSRVAEVQVVPALPGSKMGSR
jgi:hypothetical protein